MKMNLKYVIEWLENGCSIDDAISELKLLQAKEDEKKQKEPFGIWHQADDPDECEFYLYSESGDVACDSCVKLYKE
jgi:predicted molibdopterin-dependent oxidoreductase YjgC